MTSTTTEWVRKAEGDYDIVCILRRSRKPARYDGICFHCQQCVEKYLKARLNQAAIHFPKTHDLSALLKLVSSVEPTVRYPGNSTDRAAAAEAFATCRKLRSFARASLQ